LSLRRILFLVVWGMNDRDVYEIFDVYVISWIVAEHSAIHVVLTDNDSKSKSRF
jgi:hypothetical protein